MTAIELEPHSPARLVPSSSSSTSLSPAPSSPEFDPQNHPPLSPLYIIDNTNHNTSSNNPKPDLDHPVLYFAVGKDMNPAYMREFSPSARIIDVARLDNYEYIIDAVIEEPCVSPCSRETENGHSHESQRTTTHKVVYGMLYEIDERALSNLHASWTGPDGETMQMAKVSVMRIRVNGNLGWGPKRDMHEVGWARDVVVFVGSLGEVDVGLAEGCNEEVNVGIVQGCIWGIPDRWVEENVRRWVKRPTRRLFW